MSTEKLRCLWEKQNRVLRNPVEIFGASFKTAGITADSFKVKASGSFIELLNELNVTLVVTREYENLIVAFTSIDQQLVQSFFHVPHPSGIVWDEQSHSLYVASTRNPNQVVEFRPQKANNTQGNELPPLLMPARTKFYGGAFYFHELGIIAGKLYANAAGMNGIINIDFNSVTSESICWWPRCVEDESGFPRTGKNYIQLNSIAPGDSLGQSFFTASSDRISHRRPGHKNFAVNKRGVIFSGRTREPVVGGLTRPHSARLNDDLLWVNNSGYGEVGYIRGTVYNPVQQFNGWTRGLCFKERYMFVGISRILPRFRNYAPGITSENQTCSVAVVDTSKNKIVASIQFPYGNQIFDLAVIPGEVTAGFPFRSTRKAGPDIIKAFSNFKH
jgi:uncharacterized protein (TIGR03032 family)